MTTFLLIAIVILAALAVSVNDLLRGAICLAGASALLALVIFRMGQPYAAVFELSVAAGLITVLFASTISLVRRPDQYQRDLGLSAGNPGPGTPLLRLFGEDAREGKILKGLSVALALFAALLWSVRDRLPELPYPASPDASFPDTLWKVRTFDLFGQIIVILSGLFLVIHFFKRGEP